MSEITFTSRLPDSADSERQLLARMLAGSISSVALASGARTSNTTTSKIQSVGFRGLITYLDVTAASGTGGLRVGLVYCDPISSAERLLVVASNPVTTTGLTQIVWGEGCAAGAGVTLNAAAGQGYVGIMLPKHFRVLVTHGDASSYTYALNLEFVP